MNLQDLPEKIQKQAIPHPDKDVWKNQIIELSLCYNVMKWKFGAFINDQLEGQWAAIAGEARNYEF